MIFLFNWVIIRFHVNFQGCKMICIRLWGSQFFLRVSSCTSDLYQQTRGGVCTGPAFFVCEIFRYRKSASLKSLPFTSPTFFENVIVHQGAFHVTHPHNFFHITALEENIGNTSWAVCRQLYKEATGLVPVFQNGQRLYSSA